MGGRPDDTRDSARPARPPGRSRADDEPVLPDVGTDERDVDRADERESGPRDDDWYRRERPPHHE